MMDFMKKDDEKIENWINYTLTAIRRDKRTRKKLDIKSYFQSLKENWGWILKNYGIEIDILTPENTFIRTFEADLDSIFNNLIANSIKYLGQVNKKNKKIFIDVKGTEDDLVVNFEDNGIGLSEAFSKNPDEIFKPFITSEVDARWNQTWTGLGLFIVKSIIQDYENSSVQITKIHGWFGINIHLTISK